LERTAGVGTGAGGGGQGSKDISMGALMAAKPREGAEEKNSRVLGLGRRRRSCGGIGEWTNGDVWRRIGFPALEVP
jgi:hypothetical protein